MDGFWKTLYVCQFSSMWFEGHPFTWSNNHRDADNTLEKLDRVLMNDVWPEMFSCSQTEHLPKRRSDHLPLKILIQHQIIVAAGNKTRRRGFKFEKEWLRDEECMKLVKKSGSLFLQIVYKGRLQWVITNYEGGV